MTSKLQKLWLNLDLYRGKWIALNKDEDKVVAYNRDAKLAYQNAVLKGVKTPILFKVPMEITPYIGSI